MLLKLVFPAIFRPVRKQLGTESCQIWPETIKSTFWKILKFWITLLFGPKNNYLTPNCKWTNALKMNQKKSIHISIIKSDVSWNPTFRQCPKIFSNISTSILYSPRDERPFLKHEDEFKNFFQKKQKKGL